MLKVESLIEYLWRRSQRVQFLRRRKKKRKIQYWTTRVKARLLNTVESFGILLPNNQTTNQKENIRQSIFAWRSEYGRIYRHYMLRDRENSVDWTEVGVSPLSKNHFRFLYLSLPLSFLCHFTADWQFRQILFHWLVAPSKLLHCYR